MIFLFDDTTELAVREHFNKSDYLDVLRCSADAAYEDVIHNDELQESDSVLIHRSYPNKELYRYITRDVSKWGKEKTLVVFSGEDEPVPVFHGDNCIKKMSKELFYDNLSTFLEYYRRTERPDLAVLAYGEKKDANYALSKVGSLLSSIKFLKDYESLPLRAIDLQDLKDLLEVSAPEIALSFDDLSKTLSSNHYTVGSFRGNLVSIANSFVYYGKNIHHWRR